MSRQSGVPAFPDFNSTLLSGTTLRDWFAGMALMLMSQRQTEKLEFDKLSEAAYRLADAMLKEREKE